MNSMKFDRRRYLFLSLPLVAIVAIVGVTIPVHTVRESQLQAETARRLQEFTEKALQVPLSYEGWSGEIWESDPESLERYNSKYEDGWIYWSFKHSESGAEISVLLCRGHRAPISHICLGCEEDNSATFVVAADVGIVPFQLGTRRYCQKLCS